MREPRSAADRRPNDEPYFVPKTCSDCRTKLVYSYLLDDPDAPEEKRWYDEFECPKCRNGLVLDVPERCL